MQIIKQFTGHSGCKIYLCKRGGATFVRKISSSSDYNWRLRAQCKKQHIQKHEYFGFPRVYGSGYDSGLFYFDMEYIFGQSMCSIIENLSINEIKAYIDIVLRHIPLHCEPARHAVQLFGRKIVALCSIECDDQIYREGLALLKTYDFSHIPHSQCFGDLTLENIIVADKIYIIDLLDSFYDSWMIDIAKLLQDLELKWSYRHVGISTSGAIKLELAKDLLVSNIKDMFGKQTVSDIYHILLLNVMRIFPYVKDNDTQILVNLYVTRLLQKIRRKLL